MIRDGERKDIEGVIEALQYIFDADSLDELECVLKQSKQFKGQY